MPAKNKNADYRRARSGRPVARLRALVRSEGTHICYRCGDPIDMSLDRTHAMSWTIEHKIPLSERPDLGMSLSNIAESHRRCNSAHGAQKKDKNIIASRKW